MCINLYRSIQVGTIPQTSIKTFISDCLATWHTEPKPTLANEAYDRALRCVKEWSTRSASSRNNRFPIFAANVQASQLGTVIHYKDLVVNAAAVHRTYSARSHCTADDLNALIQEWKTDRATWKLGNNRDFYWVAPLFDWSAFSGARMSAGVAQLCCDYLGLCHWGAGDTLIRVTMPASAITSAHSFFRPTAFDGMDNPAFRAACDGETKPGFPCGRTADVAKIKARAANVDGAQEWICAPIEVYADQLVWDYLGEPNDPVCSNDTSFHDDMLAALEQTTPLSTVMPFLRSLI